MTEAVSKSLLNFPLPANETERLAALRRYNILDTPPEKAFDRITTLAARLFGVPTVLISLVDESRAWFKSCYGFSQQQVERDATICSFALLYDGVLVVPDARKDDRFACNPFVQTEPGLRFYAGAPLLTPEGFNLGTLCLLDTQPRDTFTAEQIATLTDLAAMVMDELDLRLAIAMQRAAEREQQQAEQQRQEAAQHLQLYADVVRNTQVGIVVWQLEDLNDPRSFRLLIANPAASEVTGFNFESIIGTTMAESFPKLLQTPLVQQYLEVIHTGRSLDLGEVAYGEDGMPDEIYTLKAFPLPNHCLGLAFENITARKQLENQLKESQHYNQQIAEALPGVLFVHDIIHQQNVYTNRQVADLLGYTSEQIQEMGTNALAILIHPDDLERVFDYFQAFQTTTDTGVLGIEYRVYHANGEWRWLYSQSVVFNRTADGLPHQILGVSIDISDRKRSEAILSEQEARYRYIFETVGVAIWEEDFSAAKTAIDRLRASGVNDFHQYIAEHPEFVQQMANLVRIRDVNQAALHMFAAQEKSELLASLNQIFTPETEAAFVEEILAIAQGETSFAAETVVQTLQGDRLNVWFSMTFPPISEPYDHVLVSLLDITQRKQAEAELQASEERYRHLAEVMPQIVWTTDASGMVTYFSPHWYTYTGLNEAESMGLESLNAMHPDDRDRVLQQWLLAVQNSQEYEIEIRLRRWDGVYRWFLCRALPVRDANGDIVSWVGTDTDIDDQKRVQEALRESEERLSLALHSAQAGMWQWFKADNRTIWSDENFELLGYEPGQVASTYDNWMQAVHPDDREMAQQAVQQALDENTSLYCEYRVCLPDGSVRWCADIGQIMYDDQGNQDGMIGLQIDISKRKQIELERERSEAILNAFLTASPIALTLFDCDLRFIYANEALAQINGLPLNEHLGQTLWDVVPDMAPQFVPMLQQIITTQEPVLNLEYNGEVRPGVYRHTIANHFPVCLPNGEVLGVGVTVTDISELKRIEAELRQSEERLSLALKAANQGLYDLNVKTGEAIVSPEYARMLGYEPEEFQETNAAWRDRMHPDDVATVYRVYEEYVAGLHNEYCVEFRQRTRTGGWVWILSIGKIVSWDEDGNPLRMLGTHTNISDRKRAEQALQQQAEDLAQANRVKDEFLAVLSHELRSPLNPILGWTKLLQTGNFDPQKTKQALEVIERNAKQQTQLIDDLLDISKILRGKLVLSEAPVDLALIIEAALETVRLSAEAKDIQVKTVLNAYLPPVLGDGGRLQQVVLNLLSNAIKFTSNGGRVEVRLEVGNGEWGMGNGDDPTYTLHPTPYTPHPTPNSPTYAQIVVTDTGKGIVPDFLPYVFDSFRQEDGRTTRKFGGLGLGLAIVRQLTELHGGTVHAESQGEGCGATFTVRLPLMKQAFGTRENPLANPSLQQIQTLQDVRVLVVDDEADMRDLVVTILEQVGAIAHTATSATEALAALNQFQPMIIVSDIGMPDIDGYTLMRRIRSSASEHGRQILAIALTAYASEFDQQLALQAGFQKHLSKPIEPEELIRAIAALVNS